MSMLHIVNKSPFERVALESCLNHVLDGDAVLLIEDAAVGAVEGSKFADQLKASMSQTAVYVLGGDLNARGMSDDRVIEGITIVDYDGFVDLVAEHDKTQSWL